MTDYQLINQEKMRTFIILTTVIGIAMITVAAFGHGGKHSENFTHLQALQKATGLYDKLINDKKLDQSWETDLKQVTVSNRQKGNEKEIVVGFHRGKGDPAAVFIFFSTAGKYIGSNFSGD